ncbi:MAG: PDZ domain-containing protein [SAR202 cluster bacterium]|nr:PDZ domain-containing protein [SAR202 cluster bacterium]
MSIKARKILFFPLMLLLLALLLSACDKSPFETDTVTPTPGSTATSQGTPIPTATVPAAAPVSVSSQELSVPEIVQRLKPSVVHIQTEAVRLDSLNRPVPSAGVGTGEILDTSGHVLTNNHVVEGAQRVIVTLSDGRPFEARIIGGDAQLDLAVLKIEAGGLTPIPIGQSSSMQVGDRVIAIGHALNLVGGPTVTGGLVSALDRSIDIDQNTTIQHLIQTDAAINPGNSGGPLVNSVGQLIGINTARLPDAQGVGFAIAIDPVKPLIQELIQKGSIDRGFLGVSIVTVTPSLAANFNLSVKSGVAVTAVSADAPAQAAGIRAGDIIVSLAGRPVNNVAELDRILIENRAGTTVEVEVVRGTQRMKFNVTLAQRPR